MEKNCKLSETQTNALREVYNSTIQTAIDAMDRLYENFLNGRIERQEYHEKLSIWENRYYEATNKLKLI